MYGSIFFDSVIVCPFIEKKEIKSLFNLSNAGIARLRTPTGVIGRKNENCGCCAFYRKKRVIELTFKTLNLFWERS